MKIKFQLFTRKYLVISVVIMIGTAIWYYGEVTSGNFRAVLPNRSFEFPLDHAPHPDWKTEWWYFTGHLYLDDHHIFNAPADYGFQLTFFRNRDDLQKETVFAHGALSSIRQKTFTHEKRYSLPGAGLATLSTTNFNATIQDWSGAIVSNQLALEYSVKGCRVHLTSSSLPPPILQGNSGFSPKSNDPLSLHASYYYSIPRINLTGIIQCDNQSTVRVTGLGWMDHEFMSEPLSTLHVGWDWLSLMNKDGSSVMVFRVRGASANDDFLSGTWFDPSGVATPLSSADIVLTPTGSWKSRSTDATYPTSWRVEIPKKNFSSVIHPRIPDQEILGGEKGGDAISYWEGAVMSADESTIGYLELTGYESPLRMLSPS